MAVNIKNLTIILVALAVIIGASAAVVVTINLASKAESEKALAISKEETARLEAKRAKDELVASDLRKQESELRLKAEQEARLRKEEEAKVAEAEAKKAEEDRLSAIERAKASQSKKEEAALILDAKKLEAKRAADEKAKAESIEKASHDKLLSESAALEREKLASEKIIAEAKILEGRKIDFETWQQQLIQLKIDLDDREAALKPEKSVMDLEWVGSDDTAFDEKGHLVKKAKVQYLAENDTTLSKSTRELSRFNRVMHESQTNRANKARLEIEAALLRLYEKAVKEDRIVDADYYKKSLKTLCP